MALILMRKTLIIQIILLWVCLYAYDENKDASQDEFVNEIRKRLNIQERIPKIEWKNHDEFNLGDAYGINPEDILKWMSEGDGNNNVY